MLRSREILSLGCCHFNSAVVNKNIGFIEIYHFLKKIELWFQMRVGKLHMNVVLQPYISFAYNSDISI